MAKAGASQAQAFCYRSDVKRVGKRRTNDDLSPVSPEEALARATVLQRQLELLNPYPRPRGFVFKAKTREDYERWRREQPNPRLW
ncbi:MAG: hypothetical protein KDM81_20905 [Verrucomicrobiae bacterium]|nr:hypothetical protein [Verrucomicrobiae bacterium]MCP5520158.1 hypothetical protein [Verrucomicrobiales bacterium]